MKILAQKLLGLISTSLGLSSLFIEEAMGELYQNITISYYPSCPQPELTLGLQSHSDMGFITLLIQDDVAGLQVLKDDEWVTVDPVSRAILVILGDQTEIITNGIYKSSVHRAITNANKARLSVATFHDPAKTTTVSPAFKPPRYNQVVYGDYVKSWYTKGPNGKRNIDALLI
ncbi:probable 2-oxoglutarate-dependent dioxygenase ANS [Tanacetum coccineum]